MKIKGIDGMSRGQVRDEIERGGKFVIYRYCISVFVMTFQRGSDIYFIRAGENAVVKGLPFTFLSLAVGWWGFPWGLIYTPGTLYTTLRGGNDVTGDVMAQIDEHPATAPVGASRPDRPTMPDNLW